jgi:hypothetical protein
MVEYACVYSLWFTDLSVFTLSCVNTDGYLWVEAHVGEGGGGEMTW